MKIDLEPTHWYDQPGELVYHCKTIQISWSLVCDLNEAVLIANQSKFSRKTIFQELWIHIQRHDNLSMINARTPARLGSQKKLCYLTNSLIRPLRQELLID